MTLLKGNGIFDRGRWPVRACRRLRRRRRRTITIGFVTHAQGNPFIQQIVDGAQAAADDLGVTLQVAQHAGGDPEGQLQLVQNFVNAGAQGVATSVPGESMAKGLNDIIESGVPIVQYNLL